MSKGLEALKSMWLYIDEPTKRQFALQDYKDIEKELKRLEELEKAFVTLSKDDEKAKKLLSLEIEKNRALEIIKNNVVATPNIPIIKTPAGEFIEITFAVTKDKYDLLKEVFL